MHKSTHILFFAFSVLFAAQITYGQQPDSTGINEVVVPQQESPVTEPKPQPQPKVRKDTRPLKQRLAFGFGSAFWITPTQTYFELAPVLAYRFPKTLITGIGYRYIYRHERLIGQNLNAYGPNTFVRVNVTKRIYLWSEYEILANEYEIQVPGVEFAKEKTYSDSWFAGLGYVRSFGKKGKNGVSFQLLYNMLYNRDENSPYYSPLTYRVGYYF